MAETEETVQVKVEEDEGEETPKKEEKEEEEVVVVDEEGDGEGEEEEADVDIEPGEAVETIARKAAEMATENTPSNLSPSGSPNEQYGGYINSENKVHHVFVFCNPTSGGNQAAKLVDINVDELRFHHSLLPSDQFVHAYIFNLKKPENKQRGFEKLGNLVRNMPPGEDVVAVAAGGDGTVKWVLGELRKPGVEALGVPIGVIPFGTGNDFSRVMEWGPTAPTVLIGYGMSALRNILVQFVLAEQRTFDVWSVKLEVDKENGGHFLVVDDGQTVPRPDGKTELEEEMINYFSIGADAQVAFGFEQNRRTTRAMNYVQYAMEGSKLVFGKSPLSVQAQGLESVEREGGTDAISGKKNSSSKDSPTDGQTPADENVVKVQLKKPMSSIVMQNIPSYSAGSNFWGPPKKKSPFVPQNVGDGLLEMMQLKKVIDVGLHKATSGTAGGMGKLAQARKYTLNFKQRGSTSEVYFQVDGEAQKAVGLKKAEVTHAFKVIILKRRHPASALLSEPSMAEAQKKIEKRNKDKKGFVSTVPLQGQVFRRTGHRSAWKVRHAALIVSRFNPEDAYNRQSVRKSMKHGTAFPKPEVSLCMYRHKKKVLDLELKHGQVVVFSHDQVPEKERVWTPNPSSTFRITLDSNTIKRPVWICAQDETQAAEWMEVLTDQSLWQP